MRAYAWRKSYRTQLPSAPKARGRGRRALETLALQTLALQQETFAPILDKASDRDQK